MGLMGLVEELSVTVVEGATGGSWGTWEHESRTITVRPGLGVVQRRSVLARMLGHAALGHEEVGVEEEAAAAQWAARELIAGARVASTLKAVNWVGLLARELEVMPSDVVAFCESLSDEEMLQVRSTIMMGPRGFGGGG